MNDRIFLIGLSGSGKSTVGHLLAARLGWPFLDTDALIEGTAGRSISEIFNETGEAEFRALEARALETASSSPRAVVATGGGAPTHEPSRRLLSRGFTVWLDVSPEVATARLAQQLQHDPRPLVAGDPRERFAALLETRLEGLYRDRLEDQLEIRRRAYASANVVVNVDNLSPEQVAAEVMRLWENSRPELLRTVPGSAAAVRTIQGSYPIIVREGALQDLGALCLRMGHLGRAFLLTDAETGDRFAPAALASLDEAGYHPASLAIPSGEQYKNVETVTSVYDWLLSEHVERRDLLICLGGGVVTDLGGFVGATVLRGIPFVHVPTTLLGMVDAAIGGKTGVDHANGKNLVGAFAQPDLVLSDPTLLATLPPRHIRAGLAEIVKHGFILDEELVCLLEACDGDQAALAGAEIITRSVAIKADVVSGDEREMGQRTLLNYGHTIGHGIEAAAGFSGYLHGEAVAIGMHAAGRIACEMGMLPPEDLERQQRLLRACGLPEQATGISREDVLTAMRSDKKIRDGEISWVLLERIGKAVIRRDVPAEAVAAGLDAVIA